MKKRTLTAETHTENYIQNPRNDGLRPGALGKVRNRLKARRYHLAADLDYTGPIRCDCAKLLLHLLVLRYTHHRRRCRRHILGKIQDHLLRDKVRLFCSSPCIRELKDGPVLLW